MIILDYVKGESLRQAGVPILAAEIDDPQFELHCITPALYEYFTYAPYEYRWETRAPQMGPMIVQVPDPTTQAGWPAGVTAEFVGLVGLDYNSNPPAIYGYGGGELYREQAMYDWQATIMDQTIRDLSLPDENFIYDPVLKQFTVYTPSAGRVGICFGYRLNKIIYVKPSHGIVFAKMVAKKFLELLISGRSNVVITSDVVNDVTFMKERLELLNADLPTDQAAIATPFLTWG